VVFKDLDGRLVAVCFNMPATDRNWLDGICGKEVSQGGATLNITPYVSREVSSGFASRERCADDNCGRVDFDGGSR
jgi:hypothetical protein